MEFLKKIFGKNKEQDVDSGNYVVATINDKIMPIDRGTVYEDPLEECLEENKIGEVVGGGTLQLKTGELEHCDIEILLKSRSIDENQIKKIIDKLEELGAPKGSFLTIEKSGQKIEFGKLEGLGIYLDKGGEKDKVFEHLNKIFNDLLDILNDKSIIVRSWEGENEVALYYYSDSFEAMKEKAGSYLTQYKEIENIRYEKIA